MKNSIFIKLVSSNIVIILLALSVVGLSEIWLMKNYLMSHREAELLVRSQDLAKVVKPLLIQGKDPREMVALFNRADRILGTEIWVIDKRGKVLAAAADHIYCEGNTLEAADLEHLKQGHVTVKRGQSKYFKEAVIRTVAPILNNGDFAGGVILYSPVTGINETSAKMIRIYMGAALFAILLSAALGFVLARHIAKPLREASRVAGKIAEGDFNQQVEVKSDDEFGRLGDAINHMTCRLANGEKLRQDFIANVSHELRSPMTSIGGFVDALLEERYKDREEERKYLGIIQKETFRLNKLINDLLEISRFDSQGVEFNLEPFPIGTVVNRAVASLKPLLAEKELTVNVDAPGNLPLCYGDEDRIEQVIHNLLSNAIRFSFEKSNILISCRAQHNEMHVKVKDWGYGIPAIELPLVWERFYRVDKDRSRQKGGTGLGLSIVGEIIKKHGGRVMAESNPGEGAVFGFTLPLAKD